MCAQAQLLHEILLLENVTRLVCVAHRCVRGREKERVCVCARMRGREKERESERESEREILLYVFTGAAVA